MPLFFLREAVWWLFEFEDGLGSQDEVFRGDEVVALDVDLVGEALGVDE